MQRTSNCKFARKLFDVEMCGLGSAVEPTGVGSLASSQAASQLSELVGEASLASWGRFVGQVANLVLHWRFDSLLEREGSQ